LQPSLVDVLAISKEWMMKPLALPCGAAIAAASLLMSLTLAGCDGKSSAVAGRDPGVSAFQASNGRGATRAQDPRDLPVPQIEGKPMWAANRTHTAEENAQYQFTKNGGDFSAASESDYVLKAHAFVDKPPRGVQTLDRSNGDKLIYDAKANVFAVVSSTGAPRTMFKPRGGASYWAQQKARDAAQASGRGSGGNSDQG
jgi:pyocin large subunit-like protein